jgi:hypothetical protein
MAAEPVVRVHGEHAAELYELLGMMADFIDHDFARLNGMLERFMGSDGYTLEELRGDLARFIFLLGGPGDRLVHGGER